MEEKNEKLVIIGSGPAGLTAAIYAARGNLNPVVVSGRSPGGQLMLTSDVDDFPGFPQGVKGPELMAKIRAQAERLGTTFIEEDTVEVNFKKTPLEIRTETKSLLTQAVIIATGSSAKWLGLESEYKLIGRGVSACAVCDGPFFKDKKVVVVGGGDVAMREAQHLSKTASSVTVIHRRDTLRAQGALQSLVKAKPNVSFILNTTVEEILGDDRVEAIRIKNTQTGKVSELAVDGVFVAIGHNPNTKFLEGQLELDKMGYVVISDDRHHLLKDGTHTSVEGVFAAGDVADFHYRQGITAAGAGCKAALDAEEYLERIKV